MRPNRSLEGLRSMQKIALASLALASGVALVVACGDDPAERPSYGDDGGDAQASIPDSGTPYDGSTPIIKDPYSSADEEVVCASEAGACVKELVAGEGHFCARLADGTVRCWGKNDFGNLGRGAAGDAGVTEAGLPPAPVTGLTGVTQISAAANTTCARLDDGTLRCWGRNKYGELGLTPEPATSDEDPHPEPAAPADVVGASRVAVAHGSVCALLESGKLVCWGNNEFGQLARPIASERFAEAPGEATLDGLAVKTVQGGSNSTLGLTASGDLWVWGALSGQNGFCAGVIASISPSTVPFKSSLSKVTNFGVSLNFEPERPPVPPGQWPGPPLPHQAHGCAISEGEVYCWGRSDKAALCTGLPDPERVPRRAPLTSKAWPQRLAVGLEITCVRMTDGTIQCCGGNERGRLGQPKAKGYSPDFIPVSSFKGHAVQVAASNASVCALLQGGTVQCWGSNVFGELGIEPDEDEHPEVHDIAF